MIKGCLVHRVELRKAKLGGVEIQISEVKKSLQSVSCIAGNFKGRTHMGREKEGKIRIIFRTLLSRT